MTSPKSNVKLADRAYEALKEMAVAYRFRPGERLAEVELARRLNVSRTPIREALHRLVMEGFLTFSESRGFHGRPLDTKEVFDLYELRRSLEATAVGLAIERAGEEELKRLADFVAESRSVPETTDVIELVRLDEAFHEGLATLSGNGEILRVLQNVNERIRFCRWIDMETGRRSQTQSEHAEIVAAAQARDRPRAEAVVNRHIARRLDQIVAVIREGYARIYMGAHTAPGAGV
jgi:DNA-binding GntR family transcriptional regulator